ncbi:unnamed protein product, partial [Rotaria sordida]
GVKNIVIGNIVDDHATQAREDGFNPLSIEEIVRQGDILMLLISDADQQTVWNGKIRTNIKINIARRYGCGAGIRDRYVQNIPYPCFISVEKDASSTAIGATRGDGTVGSSCREEAGIDLFAEQALWSEIMAICREDYHVLHEAILFDTYLSKEPAEIFENVADEQFVKQLKYHSPTSHYGQLSTMNRQDRKNIHGKISMCS